MAKRVQPGGPMASFAAAQPIRGGMAPGTAPTTVHRELIFFKGVYITM